MPTKSVIVAILATVLLFGTVVSGCKRNRDQSVASAKTRRNSNKQNELSSVRNVRPAEVLSASAYRPPVRRQQGVPARQVGRPQQQYNNPGYNRYQQQYNVQPGFSNPAPTYQMARAASYEPLPEPVPVSQLASASNYYSAPVSTSSEYAYSQPVSAPAQYRQSPSDDRYGHLPEYAYSNPRSQPALSRSRPVPAAQTARPQSPDLAMARARLQPRSSAAPASNRSRQIQPAVAQAPRYEAASYNYDGGYDNGTSVPRIEPAQFNAPLPELEPVRYTPRVAENRVPHLPRVVPTVPALNDYQQVQNQQWAGQDTYRQASASYESGDAQNALAPVNQADNGDIWIPSTATAMYW